MSGAMGPAAKKLCRIRDIRLYHAMKIYKTPRNAYRVYRHWRHDEYTDHFQIELTSSGFVKPIIITAFLTSDHY